MWYKLAAKPKDFVIAYHGTDEISWKEIQKSGYLRTNGIANLTVDKEVAVSYANEMSGGEDVVVLSFKFPREFILQSDDDNILISLKGNLPLSYLVGQEKVKVREERESFEDQVHNKMLSIQPKMQPQDYQKMKEEVLRNLSRNPSAYIPLYMRNDPDLARYMK